MRTVLVVVALAGACGGDDGGSLPKDAAIDVPEIDALFATGPQHRYVIDKMLLPQTNTQSREYGLDLNSDGTIDNQLGMVISSFQSMGLDAQGPTDRAIDRGQSIELINFQAPDLTAADVASFMTVAGANPTPAACSSSSDTTCRHHLDGSATFGLAATSSFDRIFGPIVNGTYAGGPGHLTALLPLFGASPSAVTLLGARVKLSGASDAAITSGVIAGGVTKTDIDSKLIPALQVSFSAVVMADCTAPTNPPACGCVQDSQGKTYLGLFDTTPKDCAISVDEIRNNSLIVSLLAPDLTIDGQQALSFGFGFTAVRADFHLPGDTL